MINILGFFFNALVSDQYLVSAKTQIQVSDSVKTKAETSILMYDLLPLFASFFSTDQVRSLNMDLDVWFLLSMAISYNVVKKGISEGE